MTLIIPLISLAVGILTGLLVVRSGRKSERKSA